MHAVEYYEKKIAAETDESKKKKLCVDSNKPNSNSLKLVYAMCLCNLSIYSDEEHDISEDDGDDDGEDEVNEGEVIEREVNDREEDGNDDGDTDESVIEDINTDGFYGEIVLKLIFMLVTLCFVTAIFVCFPYFLPLHFICSSAVELE